MRCQGLRSKAVRRFVVHNTDSHHPHPIAENRLDRQFRDEVEAEQEAEQLAEDAELWL